METETPTIQVQLKVRETFDCDVSLMDIMDAVNDLELPLKWNAIGSLLNGIDLEADTLNQPQREIILKWLTKQISKFKQD